MHQAEQPAAGSNSKALVQRPVIEGIVDDLAPGRQGGIAQAEHGQGGLQEDEGGNRKHQAGDEGGDDRAESDKA